ncbi:MAG: hypothetical protein IT204_02860 [Fimbriimonadaceae bacterium]|nr:hypothetical protein [Fimbriimonadaceae bacterium]
MGYDLWQRLVVWEVRHALRGKLFWVMAAAVAAVPWLVAADCGLPAQLGAGLAASQVTVTFLVALWTVFAVKRQLDKDVSDDWLLVLSYRQSLASRFVAGGVLGLLLVAVAAVALWSSGLTSDSSDLSQSLGLLCISLLQPLAIAAIVVAAADFLLASTPLVLFVVTVLALGSELVPVFGFAVPLAMASADNADAAVTAGLLAVCCIGICSLLLLLGWRKAEDFWAYLRIAKAKAERDGASLGEVRGAVQQQAAQRRRGDHSSTANLRARWRRHGWEPLWAFDLARYPAWVRPRREHLWVGVLLLVGLIYTLVYAAVYESNAWIYLSYFGWWVLAATTLLRVLVSAAGIVVQEEEQGTLAALLVTPQGARWILWVKLGVVLRQALPALLVLTVWQQVWLRGLPGELTAGLWAQVPALAVCGLLCSAVAGSRLLATILAFAASGTTLIAAAWLTLQIVSCWRPDGDWSLSKTWLESLVMARAAGLATLVGLVTLLWTVLVRPCGRLLYRQAA